MKNCLKLSLLIYFALSCTSKRNNKILSTAEPFRIKNDSIRIVAESILRGDHIWGKNEKYIFTIMDSLTCSNPKSRVFYFKVFGEIFKQADGYIAESMGIQVLKTLEFNPAEFINNSKLISDTTFKSMAYFAGAEIYMNYAQSADKEFENLKSRIKDQTENASDSCKTKLNLFLEGIKKGIHCCDSK